MGLLDWFPRSPRRCRRDSAGLTCGREYSHGSQKAIAVHPSSQIAPATAGTLPRPMGRTDMPRFSGLLQQEVMRILWRRGQGTVDDVRDSLPRKSRSAYTTVQTVLNRLSDRGLLTRERRRTAIVYTPRLSEAQYLRRSLDQTLAGASAEARQSALAGLVGDLDADELQAIRARAREVARRRQDR